MAEVSIPRIKACAILKNLRIAVPSEISIEEIAWARGALVIEGGLSGAEARLIYTPDVKPAIIRINSSIEPPNRRRFAIAHELGHCELKHNPGNPIECSEEDFRLWYQSQKQIEVEANTFAAELLMPENMFGPKARSVVASMDAIETLAETFQTTLTAAAVRFIDLCEQRCAIVQSSAGKIDWVRMSSEFGYWIAPHRKLSDNTHAVEFFRGGRLSTSIHTVRLDAWVEQRVPELAKMQEQSRALVFYRSVLTLLWIV